MTAVCGPAASRSVFRSLRVPIHTSSIRVTYQAAWSPSIRVWVRVGLYSWVRVRVWVRVGFGFGL